MNNKAILVTGAAGFIGSNLANRLLKEGYAVVGIDNFDPFYDRAIKEKNLEELKKHSGFSFYEIDIRDQQALMNLTAPIVAVVHLAAKAGVLPSIKAPQEYIDVNINGTHAILEFMKHKGINKLVFASSSSIYGNNAKVPFEESDLVDHPISPYAFTKKSCELMNYTYHHLYQFDILNLRFFTVYGPGQRPDLAIHRFIHKISHDQSIDMYGDGSTARDYTYIDDIVDGIFRAVQYVIQHDKVYDIVNIGNNSPVKLKELIDLLYELLNKKPLINQLPMQAGDVEVTFASVKKAKVLLGYVPSTSMRDGLIKFIDWYKKKSV